MLARLVNSQSSSEISGSIYNKDGEMVEEIEKVAEVFEEFFSKLYNSESQVAESEIMDYLQEVNPPRITAQEGLDLDSPISLREPLANMIKKLSKVEELFMNKEEHRLSLYADDLLFVKDPVVALPEIIGAFSSTMRNYRRLTVTETSCLSFIQKELQTTLSKLRSDISYLCEKMMHSSYLVFLLCVWFPLETVCNEGKTTKERMAVLPLQDFNINVSPGIINITWNCNITKLMKNISCNNVVFENEYHTKLNVSMCSLVYEVYSYMEFILHKGVSVQLCKENDNSMNMDTNVYTYFPDGKNNTAAENFSCVIYSVYIMNCSWTVGKEAPEDTQYTLVLRQKRKNRYETCQDYRIDSFGRQVGCVLKRPNIYFKSKVYVEVLGLSNQTTIQFYDEVLFPNHHAILDPPRNITVAYNSDELEIKWQKPETYDNMGDQCFSYNININDKEKIYLTEENVYKTTKFYPNEKVNVTMRVKWFEYCSNNDKWSAWSEPKIIGYNSTQLTPHHILIVLGVGTAIILIVLIILCYRFRIWKKLFPQVPKPSMKLFEEVEEKEKAMQKDSETQISLMKKEEEIVCSYVTEMPEKL
ncbi:granulocyte-macrophage colony-stimulating factor receptor subunit alpha-like [Hyla sarda]|uniref:granulocyte-macrophage colony-stimulating factor receptor subunit alpha-like n=1 Tax=Hyla sarda TaxID=327740 RepID=UPI0024C37B11|nr:granulocyte-macrophage colony-stimulating factor receptor subunit alpha-like [Hyla sarda]